MFSISGVQSSSKRGHLSIDHVDCEGTRHSWLEEKHISAKHREGGNSLPREVLGDFRDSKAAGAVSVCEDASGGETPGPRLVFTSLCPSGQPHPLPA